MVELLQQLGVALAKNLVKVDLSTAKRAANVSFAPISREPDAEDGASTWSYGIGVDKIEYRSRYIVEVLFLPQSAHRSSHAARPPRPCHIVVEGTGHWPDQGEMSAQADHEIG